MPTYGQITTGDRPETNPTRRSATGKTARKIAPKPKSGGKSAPKTKRKYEKKKMEYWNNRKKKK